MRKTSRLIVLAAWVGAGIAYRSARVKENGKDLSFGKFKEELSKAAPDSVFAKNEKAGKAVWGLATWGLPMTVWPAYAIRRGVRKMQKKSTD